MITLPLLVLLTEMLVGLSGAIRCYYCPTHDVATCERMATIVTCPVGFNRCYYSYSNWKPMPTTTTIRSTTTTTMTTTTMAAALMMVKFDRSNSSAMAESANYMLAPGFNGSASDGTNSSSSMLPMMMMMEGVEPPASVLAEEQQQGAEALFLQASFMEERPPEVIDRPNGEDWEKIAQGCARAGVFPCSGSEGRGTRPEQDYCFGDLSYGNCIGVQCNNPGVTPLIFGNSATTSMTNTDRTIIAISITMFVSFL